VRFSRAEQNALALLPRWSAYTHLWIAVLLTLTLAGLFSDGIAEDLQSSLSIEDAVLSRRIVYATAVGASSSTHPAQPQVFAAPKPETAGILVAPNRGRYVVVLMRGDIARNGNWAQFYSGTIDREHNVTAPTLVTELFTASSKRLPIRDQPLVWLDDEHMAFLWNDGTRPTYVAALDLLTGNVGVLASHRTSITEFAASGDRKTVIYAALGEGAPLISDAQLRDGFAVRDGIELQDLLRRAQGYSQPLWQPEVFAKRERGGAAARIILSSRANDFGSKLILAPNGGLALALAPPTSFPPEWEKYDAPFLASQVAAGRRAPGESTRITQLWLINLNDLRAQPLLDAPVNFSDTQVVWSRDSASVLIGPTFLPAPRRGSSGDRGQAFIVMSLATGEYHELRSPMLDTCEGCQPMLWDESGVTKIGNGSTAICFAKVRGEWLARKRCSVEPESPSINLTWKQSRDEPPVLVTRALGSQEVSLLEVNPGLVSRHRLGKVQAVSWNDHEGIRWEGRVYYPVGYQPGRSYPLVIQPRGITYDYYTHASTFSLLGGDFVVTAFAAQPLASRGIAVLEIDEQRPELGGTGTSRELDVYLRAFESGARYLVGEGLARQDKVGLVGYSRYGGRVLYTLAHSSFPFKTAIVADNADNSYLQYLMAPASYRSEFEQVMGAAPIGSGLNAWLQRAPGFNPDKIHAPLRMQVDSYGLTRVLFHWELFSTLRYLRKPAELYVIPDVENGEHGLERPDQQLASLRGTVDWMDFWLNDRERDNPLDPAQVARWRALRKLHLLDTGVTKPETTDPAMSATWLEH
jgi:hypothetical protein